VFDWSYLYRCIFVCALLGASLPGVAQQALQGMVVDAAGKRVSGASVKLAGPAVPSGRETTTTVEGVFSFPNLPPGGYTLTAHKAEYRSQSASATPPGSGIVLVLQPDTPQAMEFSDKPDFTVAGVTDWTAVGGHGSDATLRTSEALARETLNLKPHGATGGEVEEAERHRQLGEQDEKNGDPLAAVHEEELAVRLDPSEENYFAWGSELLLHRAIWQAAEVFRNGVKAHPSSARMLTGLGAALFAGDLYEEAADRLCQASDLNPGDPEPYTFMGRMLTAAPKPLPCIEPRLKRFAEFEPGNAQALYFYAMAILPTPQAEMLLNRAVAIDPACAPAYLQLGILAYSHHEPERAIAFYKRAIDADPQLSEAHYRLGVSYDRAGAAEKAAHEFQLHDEIEKQQAAEVERQRQAVKQFLVVLAH
jgi:tetratricopeptide (TPR) repeat protein